MGSFLDDVCHASGISQRMNITHVASEDFYGCYYQASLPDRSFVFNGNVTTMKGHSVISTDLDTSEQRWILDTPKPTDTNQCVFWFYSRRLPLEALFQFCCWLEPTCMDFGKTNFSTT
jgi:hypothetical protein